MFNTTTSSTITLRDEAGFSVAEYRMEARSLRHQGEVDFAWWMDQAADALYARETALILDLYAGELAA